MLNKINHRIIFFYQLLIVILTLICLPASLFALPLKTKILNSQGQPIGIALVYIDYVELERLDGTLLGRLGFVNIEGGFQIYIVRDDGQQNLVGSARNRRLFNIDQKLLGHYDWTSFWSYAYKPNGEKLGKAKCIAFRGICSAGIATYLTKLVHK